MSGLGYIRGKQGPKKSWLLGRKKLSRCIFSRIYIWSCSYERVCFERGLIVFEMTRGKVIFYITKETSLVSEEFCMNLDWPKFIQDYYGLDCFSIFCNVCV